MGMSIQRGPGLGPPDTASAASRPDEESRSSDDYDEFQRLLIDALVRNDPHRDEEAWVRALKPGIDFMKKG